MQLNFVALCTIYMQYVSIFQKLICTTPYISILTYTDIHHRKVNSYTSNLSHKILRYLLVKISLVNANIFLPCAQFACPCMGTRKGGGGGGGKSRPHLKMKQIFFGYIGGLYKANVKIDVKYI